MNQKFEYVTFISAPADKVWDALINPEIVKDYYLVPLTKIELKEGGVIEYGAPDQPMISGEILDVKEGEMLAHAFSFSENTDEPPSRAQYVLTPIGDVTHLVLTHDGFEDGSPTFQDISGGWPIILSQLKTLLETGNKIPWPKPEE